MRLHRALTFGNSERGRVTLQSHQKKTKVVDKLVRVVLLILLSLYYGALGAARSIPGRNGSTIRESVQMTSSTSAMWSNVSGPTLAIASYLISICGFEHPGRGKFSYLEHVCMNEARRLVSTTRFRLKASAHRSQRETGEGK
jgi:hypothetical protein